MISNNNGLVAVIGNGQIVQLSYLSIKKGTVDPIDQRVKLLTELASLIVYERQIANWDPNHRTFGPISITPADLPVLFLMVIDEYYSNRATKMRNSFDAIAQPFKIFGADNIEGHIDQAIETIDNSFKMQYALELFKEIFPDMNTTITEKEPDKPMFTLDNDE